MKWCIICRQQLQDQEIVCPQCGFSAKRRYFLSENQCESWLQETIEPYRRQWKLRQNNLLGEQQRIQENISSDVTPNDSKDDGSSAKEKPAKQGKKCWIPIAGLIVVAVLFGGRLLGGVSTTGGSTAGTAQIQNSRAAQAEQQSSDTDESYYELSDDGLTLTFTNCNRIGEYVLGEIGVRDSVEAIVIACDVTNIPDYAFAVDHSNLTSVEIKGTCRKIGVFAFCNCTKLERVTLPDGLQSIGNGAFDGCSSLNNITLPNSVRSIGDDAFSCCTTLKNITLPNSVQNIGNNAFLDCKNLKTITFEGALPEMGDTPFNGVTATAYYPSSWTTVPASDECGGNITWVPQS